MPLAARRLTAAEVADTANVIDLTIDERADYDDGYGDE